MQLRHQHFSLPSKGDTEIDIRWEAAMDMLDMSREMRKWEKQRLQPHLPMVSFDIKGLLKEVIISVSSVPDVPTEIFFCANKSLAGLVQDDSKSDIFFHLLLNDSRTPIQVCRHIIVHELIHMIIPPRTIDGKLINHPEEFWECEKRISPERNESWRWLNCNFSSCIKSIVKSERTIVLRTWKKVIDAEWCSWDQCMVCRDTKDLCTTRRRNLKKLIDASSWKKLTAPKEGVMY